MAGGGANDLNQVLAARRDVETVGWALGLMAVAEVALFRLHLGIFGTLALTAGLGIVVRVAGFA